MLVRILYGLPGSGKTFYTRRYGDGGWTTVVHMDDHMSDGRYMPLHDVLKNIEKRGGYGVDGVCIDSLVTTNENLKGVIREVAGFYGCPEIKVVWWEDDRDACRRNVGRRGDGRDVSVTLDNIPYEEVDEKGVTDFVAGLDGRLKISFERRKVFNDSNWDFYFQPLIDNCPESDGRYTYSDTWSLGGSWGDCWGNYGTISPEDAPKTFETFDNLLETVCPGITYLQYKKVYDRCVTTDYYEENDYYGGTERKARYRLDVKGCYDTLLETGIIGK